MQDQFEPDPDEMAELHKLAEGATTEDLIDPLAEWHERKMFILGHDLYPLKGTRHMYFEPESETVWWKSPRGWQEIKVLDGKLGKYVRLSVGLDTVRELAGCA